MRGKLVLVAVFLGLMFLDVSADKTKLKKRRKHQRTTETPELDGEDQLNLIEEGEKLAEHKYHESERLRLQEIKNQADDTSAKKNKVDTLFEDPCSLHHCGAGRICELNEEGEPECICIKECPFESDERRKVCTNHNETWASDCEVHRQRCVCMTGTGECKNTQYNHVQVEYYGACRNMPECSVEEMADFPRRMRDWLFNIMRDLADRKELSEHYLTMEREAETNLTRRWSNAAIWKWCDLDANDNDRSVSRHELFPIRAPLMALEHCISPFLNSCDVNSDHRITLKEWGKCLELDEDELEETCDDINEGNE